MKKYGFWRQFIRYLMQGLLYLIPVAVTAYTLYVSFTFVDGLLERYIENILGFSLPGLGVLIIILFVTLIGFLGSTFIFSPVINYFDRLISKAPLIKIIYTAMKDLMSAFVGQKKKFTEPVQVIVNHDPEIIRLGFLTSEDMAALGIEGEKIAVYLPYSLSVMGDLFIVDAANVKKISASPAEVMKFIVAGGVTRIE